MPLSKFHTTLFLFLIACLALKIKYIDNSLGENSEMELPKIGPNVSNENEWQDVRSKKHTKNFKNKKKIASKQSLDIGLEFGNTEKSSTSAHVENFKKSYGNSQKCENKLEPNLSLSKNSGGTSQYPIKNNFQNDRVSKSKDNKSDTSRAKDKVQTEKSNRNAKNSVNVTKRITLETSSNKNFKEPEHQLHIPHKTPNKDIKSFANLFKSKNTFLNPILNAEPKIDDVEEREIDTTSSHVAQNEITIVAMTYVPDPDHKFKDFLGSLAVDDEEIYNLRDYISNSQDFKPHTRKTNYFRVGDELMTHGEARSNARDLAISKISGKIIVSFEILKVVRILNTRLAVRDIRDIVCLSKFANVISNPNKDGAYALTIADFAHYFLGEDKNQKYKTSLDVAQGIKKIYEHFAPMWERDVADLVKNGELNQTLTPDDKHKVLKVYNVNKKRKIYFGLHCDIFEFPLWVTQPLEGNRHYFFGIDMRWNKLDKTVSNYIKIKNTGKIKKEIEGPARVNSLPFKDIRTIISSDLTDQKCRYILVGHGILSSLANVLEEDVRKYKNLHDMQLYFHLYKNEPINNTAAYLAEKYLYIRWTKEPDSWMRAKIAMQLYRLYRFEFKIDEETYSQLLKSKKYCFEGKP